MRTQLSPGLGEGRGPKGPAVLCAGTWGSATILRVFWPLRSSRKNDHPSSKRRRPSCSDRACWCFRPLWIHLPYDGELWSVLLPCSDRLDGETQSHQPLTWNVSSKGPGICGILPESNGPEQDASARSHGKFNKLMNTCHVPGNGLDAGICSERDKQRSC